MTRIDKKRITIITICTLIIITLITLIFLLPLLFKGHEKPIPAMFTVDSRYKTDSGIVLEGSLAADLAAGEKLWMYSQNAMIELTVDDTVYRYNERGDTPNFFRSPGSSWYDFTSDGLSSDNRITITVQSYYGNDDFATDTLLSQLYIGDGSTIYHLMLQNINFITFILLWAGIAGTVYIIEGCLDVIIGISTEGKRLIIFGSYCVAGVIWCLTDACYPYLTLFISSHWLAAFLDMLGILLFPIGLAIMLRYYVRGRSHRRIMGGIIAFESVVACICLVIQFAGIADLIEQQMFISIASLLMIGIATICITCDIVKYKGNYILLLVFAVLMFITVTLDGINVLWPFMAKRVLMQYGFSASIFLLLFQMITYANEQKAKEETLRKITYELENSRISVMLSQIQPHFLYNSLVGIKQLCDTDPKQASDALEHFSYYLRANLDSLSDITLIPFEKEMAHVKDYLYLEKMRFPKKLSITVNLEYTDFVLPPLTVQPIVENAVRYGITRKKGGGTLTITSEQRDNTAVITIHDTGDGFDPTKQPQDDRSHVGIDSVRKRLGTLCGGTLTIDGASGNGTTATICVPKCINSTEQSTVKLIRRGQSP